MNLVSTEWLEKNLNAVKIFDASWHMPSTNRDAKNESGIPYNDKKLRIKWKTKKPILSLRDKNHLSFLEFKKKYKGL